MKKNNIIRKALGNITLLNYENYREAYFNRWCHKYAVLFAIPLKEMVSNDYLQNWYQDQWLQKVELAFYMEYQEYLEEGVDAPDRFMDYFFEYPPKLEKHYPKTLLNMIKKDNTAKKLVK